MPDHSASLGRSPSSRRSKEYAGALSDTNAIAGRTLCNRRRQRYLPGRLCRVVAVAGTVEDGLEQCRDLAATAVTQMTLTFHGAAPEAAMARFGEAARGTGRAARTMSTLSIGMLRPAVRLDRSRCFVSTECFV